MPVFGWLGGAAGGAVSGQPEKGNESRLFGFSVAVGRLVSVSMVMADVVDTGWSGCLIVALAGH